MNGFSYQWRMAARRKAACLLVVAFTAVVTVFLLIYPRLMQNTEARLEEVYDKTEVSGWMVNGKDFTDPNIPGSDWHTLMDTGYFSEHSTYASFFVGYYEKYEVENAVEGRITDNTLMKALIRLVMEDDADGGIVRYDKDARAYSSMEACDDLMRMKDRIDWLEGYGPDCLAGDERICLMPQDQGWRPGDKVPMLTCQQEGKWGQGGIIRLTVAGVYPGSVPEFKLVMPLKTYEQLCADAQWSYRLNGFSFVAADNRQLPDLKQLLLDMGYDGTADHQVRASIDDRILEGTIAPIQSNLALLQGLYVFFFAVVAAIGFILCFLLAKGRKPEYAVMRLLGESGAQITLKALLEQSALCACGIVLGGLALMLAGQGLPDLKACGIILLCYTAGAAVAVNMTVQVNVMEILRDKE